MSASIVAAAERRGALENHKADIAERLLAHNCAEEAFAWLDRGDPDPHTWEELRRADLRMAALGALGRTGEAQALPWRIFERWLGAEHLRAGLRVLPDFGDVEAEDRAIAHALAHVDRDLALAFLVARLS